MPRTAPEFWRRRGALSALLAPAGYLYDAAGMARFAIATPYIAPVPVICVGNLTVGGAGKTPLVASLARRLLAHGVAVHILSRGYGGSETGPLCVDAERHNAAQVGDEPLMLARIAPSWIARRRADGARAAANAGAKAILMDDGMQNPDIRKDLTLLAIDGGYGFGNRRVMPAGPLRENFARGLARVDAAVMIGPDETGAANLLGDKPVLAAEPQPIATGIRGRNWVAFAGIGRPQKFFDTFASQGANLTAAHAFPDHHPYVENELRELAAEADAKNAALITTEKDWVRLAPEWRERVRVLPLNILWRDPAGLDRLLERALQCEPLS